METTIRGVLILGTLWMVGWRGEQSQEITERVSALNLVRELEDGFVKYAGTPSATHLKTVVKTQSVRTDLILAILFSSSKALECPTVWCAGHQLLSSTSALSLTLEMDQSNQKLLYKPVNHYEGLAAYSR